MAPTPGADVRATEGRRRFSLLATRSFEVVAEAGVAPLVERWIPRVPAAAGPRGGAGASLRVTAAGAPEPRPSSPPTYTIGAVEGWVERDGGRTTLRTTGGACTGELDPAAAVGELRVAPGHDAASAVFEVHSALAVASALLILRLGGFLTHAGAIVAPDGRAWLLVGDSHAGKSTTCVNLMRSGLDYLSDDNVILHVNARSGEVVVEGWPRLFHLDRGWAAGTPSGRRDTVDPAELGGRWRRTAPLGGLLFPRVSANEPTEVRPMRGAEALAGLIRQSPWVLVDRARAAEVMARLTDVARHPAHALRLGLDSYRDADRLRACLRPVLEPA